MSPIQVEAAASYIKRLSQTVPETGIILGTGLGGLVDDIEDPVIIPYTSIPDFPVSTVESHQGNLVLGTLNNKPVVVMQGRLHYYEGYSMKQVTFPVYVMKSLGIKKLFISNVSGSLNQNIKAGDLVFINDHINLFPEVSLRGKNYDELGPRFPDLFEPYNKMLIEKASALAGNLNLKFHQGVYIGLQGPHLETQAEYRYLRLIGGDCVGMSTIPEVIAACHSNIPVFTVSVITDEAFPEVPKKITIDEILAIARSAEPGLRALMMQMI
jgi:purine-nucleoside phosphorylase